MRLWSESWAGGIKARPRPRSPQRRLKSSRLRENFKILLLYYCNRTGLASFPPAALPPGQHVSRSVPSLFFLIQLFKPMIQVGSVWILDRLLFTFPPVITVHTLAFGQQMDEKRSFGRH